MIPLLIGLLVAAVGAGAAVIAFDSVVRDHITDWLRVRGRDRTYLMDAVVFLDQLGSAITAKILLRTRDGVYQPIYLDRTFRADEVSDEMRRQLALAGRAQQHVLDLLA